MMVLVHVSLTNNNYIMKKSFLLFVAIMLMSVTSALAQTSLVATLSHGGKLSTYYGADALGEAYDAAVDGDVITLSSGGFKSITVSKAITIRGAGMQNHHETHPTIIFNESGAFVITDISNKKSLQIEGICFETFVEIHDDYSESNIDVKFLKCKFQSEVTLNSTSTNFMNCVLYDNLFFSEGRIDVHAFNSVFGACTPYDLQQHLMTADHCIMQGSFSSLNSAVITNSIFTNCTLQYAHYHILPKECVVSNCLGVHQNKDNIDYFANIPTKDENWNQMVYGQNKVFKTLNGYAEDHETYELTDEAATKYLGSDGTQVGIYGGSMPFDPVPSSAQVKHFSVKTSEKDNGNISVTINVE